MHHWWRGGAVAITCGAPPATWKATGGDCIGVLATTCLLWYALISSSTIPASVRAIENWSPLGNSVFTLLAMTSNCIVSGSASVSRSLSKISSILVCTSSFLLLHLPEAFETDLGVSSSSLSGVVTISSGGWFSSFSSSTPASPVPSASTSSPVASADVTVAVGVLLLKFVAVLSSQTLHLSIVMQVTYDYFC